MVVGGSRDAGCSTYRRRREERARSETSRFMTRALVVRLGGRLGEQITGCFVDRGCTDSKVGSVS